MQDTDTCFGPLLWVAMESITKAIQSSGASEALTYLKGIGNKVKQMALNLSEIEVKVEDATSNEPWGPHGTVMAGDARMFACP